jgi:hypothetical protein
VLDVVVVCCVPNNTMDHSVHFDMMHSVGENSNCRVLGMKAVVTDATAAATSASTKCTLFLEMNVRIVDVGLLMVVVVVVVVAGGGNVAFGWDLSSIMDVGGCRP